VTRPEGATLEARNRAQHLLLADGVTVEYRRPDGPIGGVNVLQR
jgi:type I restriction enzyme R subunit